jgi:hypothetical protein
LAAGVNGVELCACAAVPEADVAVSSAAARCQQVALEWAPGQGAHCSLVGVDAVLLLKASAPDAQHVVIATAGQLRE